MKLEPLSDDFNNFQVEEKNGDNEASDLHAQEMITWQAASLKILKLTPARAASFTFTFSTIASSIMAGHLKESSDNQDFLAAITLIAVTSTTLVGLSSSGLFAINIFTSRQRGIFLRKFKANEDTTLVTQKITQVIKNGLFLACILSVFPFFFMLFSGSILTEVFGQDKNVASLAQTYLRPYAFAFLGIMVRTCFEMVIFSFEKQVPAACMALSSFSVGLTLAYLFCFGYFSSEYSGLAGIAYGFIAEAYLIALSYGCYLAFSDTFNLHNFFKNFKYNHEDLRQLKELVKIAAFLLLTTFSEVTVAFAMNIFIGSLGKDELVAQNFAAQFTSFILIFRLAFGQVACQVVSQALGEKKYHDARCFAIYGLMVSLALVFPACLIVAAYPQLLLSIFADNAAGTAVFSMLQTLIVITAVGVLFDVIRYHELQILRGKKDNATPAIISGVSLWFGLFLSYILGFSCNLGINGVATGYTLGLVVDALLLFWRAKSQMTVEALANPETENRSLPGCLSRFFSSNRFRFLNHASHDEIEFSSLLNTSGNNTAPVAAF
jgi:MATE family multidrug resistance protein